MKKNRRSILKLSAIREWSVQIIRPKKRARISFQEPEVTVSTHQPRSGNSASDDANDKAASNDPHKRIQDSVSSRKLKRSLNLDRRAANSERRVSSDPSYKGPVRRYTVDRRMSLRDRRSSN